MTDSPSDGDALPEWPSSPHEARRFIQKSIPQATPVENAALDVESYGRSDDPPVLVQPTLSEGTAFRAIRVAQPRALRGDTGFSAFLDGTQQIGIVNQIDGVPVVWATVAASIRVRVNRRLVAWKKRVPPMARRYYVPFCYIPGLNDELRNDPRVVDTGLPDANGSIPSRHPAALMERAVQRVQRDRELLEQQLAESWCEFEDAYLYVDGSIAASSAVSCSHLAVGVVKSHRRLYAEGDSFRTVMNLEAGERSSVFRIAHKSRYPVASWYVRVRPATGRDALFGLVRIEAAEGLDISERADEISRWVIAEGAPLALPDGRWDKMAYGIRDTEEFLRAIS